MTSAVFYLMDMPLMHTVNMAFESYQLENYFL